MFFSFSGELQSQEVVHIYRDVGVAPVASYNSDPVPRGGAFPLLDDHCYFGFAGVQDLLPMVQQGSCAVGLSIVGTRFLAVALYSTRLLPRKRIFDRCNLHNPVAWVVHLP